MFLPVHWWIPQRRGSQTPHIILCPGTVKTQSKHILGPTQVRINVYKSQWLLQVLLPIPSGCFISIQIYVVQEDFPLLHGLEILKNRGTLVTYLSCQLFSVENGRKHQYTTILDIYFTSFQQSWSSLRAMTCRNCTTTYATLRYNTFSTWSRKNVLETQMMAHGKSYKIVSVLFTGFKSVGWDRSGFGHLFHQNR